MGQHQAATQRGLIAVKFQTETLPKQRWGGAMRQSGIIAAAGLYALDHNIDRLADDHENAQRLAVALSHVPGVRVDPKRVETNMVFFDVADAGWKAADLVDAAKKQGVGLGAFGATTLRAVTHLDVDAAGITRAIEVLETLLADTLNQPAAANLQSR